MTAAAEAGRADRAACIAAAGGIEAAMASGALGRRIDVTLAEALVLGLLRQRVSRYVAVFGHGSTEIAEVLRVYDAAGVTRTFAVHHETEAAHAAMALRWVSGTKAAVVTSIGPGALQAMAGSLAGAADGVGVWHLYGDETTEDEGPNLQQIPRPEQGLYLRLASALGPAYSLHTPEALGPALRRGLNAVDHPYRATPFHLLLPINTQPRVLRSFSLDELPVGAPPRLGPAEGGAVTLAALALRGAERVVVKVGGGARDCGPQLLRLLELVDGVAVTSPLVPGVVPYHHPRVMGVGGSKGSISGNHAMERADVLVVVGSRSVCQADCSRTGYPLVREVVNVNADVDAATHYNRSHALVGDAARTLDALCDALEGVSVAPPGAPASAWLRECQEAKARWEAHKAERAASPTLVDEVWGGAVLTQPAAVATIAAWARGAGAVTFFDAGDVQANGFQVGGDDEPGRSFTETGASYMGFAPSAVLATAMSPAPFYAVAVCGDGSFWMQPQVLVDGVAHGATGCIVVLDNRRMGAISGLQRAQHGADHATADGVAVDYVRWAASVEGVLALDGGRSVEALREALDAAHAHGGLALVHVPVYFGDDPLGGLGAFGRWNVGSWVADTQALRHELAL